MRILQVIPFFAPAWSYGGPVKVSFDLSSELVRRGHEVTVLTTDAYNHLKRIDKVCEEINGIKILRFKNLSNSLAKRSNLYLPRGFSRYFKNNVRNYDLVHLHAFYTYQNVVAARYCQKYSIPYVIHLHEKFDATAEMGKSTLKKIFLARFGKKMLKKAEKVFSLSENEKANLLKFDISLKNKIVIIPNPAPKYRGKCQNKSSVRAKYNLTSKNKVILSLSRLSYLKGIDLLIGAFAAAVRADSEFRLIIAGPNESNYQSKLLRIIREKKIEDKVIFTGMADSRIKEELFCASDMLALFSRYESFGMVVLEALAHDLPVCLSKNVGLAKEIREVGCGLIVSDPCSATKSALELRQVFDSTQKLSQNCKMAIKSFSLPKIIDQVISHYKEIIK